MNNLHSNRTILSSLSPPAISGSRRSADRGWSCHCLILLVRIQRPLGWPGQPLRSAIRANIPRCHPHLQLIPSIPALQRGDEALFPQPCTYLQKPIAFITTLDLFAKQIAFDPEKPRVRMPFTLPRRNTADGQAIKRALFQGINYGLGSQNGEAEKLLERAVSLANAVLGEAPLNNALSWLNRAGNGSQQTTAVKLYLLNARSALRSRILGLEQLRKRAVELIRGQGGAEFRGQQDRERVTKKQNQWHKKWRGRHKTNGRWQGGQTHFNQEAALRDMNILRNESNVSEAVHKLEVTNSPLLTTAKSEKTKKKVVRKLKKWLSYLNPMKALRKIGRLFGIKAKGKGDKQVKVLLEEDKNGAGQ